MTLTRRTVLRGASWSVPVVAVAAHAPAFAASPCLTLPAITGWSETYSGGNTFQNGSGNNGFSATYGGPIVNRYLSERDSKATLATSSNATVTLSTPVTGLTVGAMYTLTFDLVSRFGNDDNSTNVTSQIQTLDVTLGSTTLFRRQKRKAANTTRAGYTDFANTPNIGATSKVLHTIVVPYTATATSATLTYLFTLPGRGGSFAAGSADIAISAPVFSCQ